MLASGSAFGDGSCVESLQYLGENTIDVTFSCTGDASDGTVPDTAIASTTMTELRRGYWLVEVYTWPGATAPTDASDFTLEDNNGLDVLGAAGTDKIDATSDLRFFPLNSASATANYPVKATSLTMKTTNQAVHSAIWSVSFVFTKIY